MTAQTIDHSWVPAAPFRAHLRLLLDLSGLPWPVMALKAGVSTRLVRRLLFIERGRPLPKLPRASAVRLIGLSDATLAELGRTLVPSDETRRDLGELLAAGCSAPALARYCRLTEPELMATLETTACTELTALLARSARVQYAG
ncbi:hypothetical protein [Propionicimonas sp.]|uniref:hypothetical protein n=1 Tax=Propionicimonas sp. TaxID=1955623 RepID=UPI00180F8FDF|nr:hypothetical protein [Propionicimonas sp.]MBU3976521.1 hypothetical protein [Actinomycetota bacterium]MBA3020478.1 hypothetical protein [Propionicimonas sp.]MBU3986652.1 hypothetical protein [Actinomycetota bacterium]MBU4007196.1 hypothetical protein [Actinomycetota bacterium]MBU4064949.1 hypothetical protein [Actinomycetota bacterium]